MPSDLNTVYRYHEETKHHPSRYARSLGFMDWSTQPDPFLRFEGVGLIELDRPDEKHGPTWGEVLSGAVAPGPIDEKSLGHLLYGSMALSAWKEVRGPDGQVMNRWSLRVNPSSGNLHPTEAWLVTETGVHHYRPDLHALERIGTGTGWPARRGVLLGLSSIDWREAWKYGERAFRYCNHDVGHAIAALSLAASAQGWGVRVLDHLPGEVVGRLLGCDRRVGPEGDHPDLLLQLGPPGEIAEIPAVSRIRTLADALTWLGEPAGLSPDHRNWQIIDEVREATAWSGGEYAPGEVPPGGPSAEAGPAFLPLVRGRRSAVSMDGRTGMSADAFYRILARTLPGRLPFTALPWPPQVSLVLFVHRVEGLDPGLYLLVRNHKHEKDLRKSIRSEAAWTHPRDCPDDLPLFQLGGGDLRNHARDLSCHQDIAADGAFSLGMLARFEESLQKYGSGFYPRLFWETGMIGQMLYLEAEVADLQGTGIGCFFDDEVHRLLGLEGHRWQSLYHFTVGKAVTDTRLQTAPAYPG